MPIHIIHYLAAIVFIFISNCRGHAD